MGEDASEPTVSIVGNEEIGTDLSTGGVSVDCETKSSF
jgi:hypothetical protein